jgi:hypothetical protein
MASNCIVSSQHWMAFDTMWYFDEAHLSIQNPKSLRVVQEKRRRGRMEERHGWRSLGSLGGILFAFILAAAPAWAALGQLESTVNADGAFLHGQIRDEVHQGYRVHLITDPAGTVVREYVSSAGVVFGVAWQGPSIPNMRQLLGPYFTHLQQVAEAQTTHHGGPLTIQQNDFVFSSGGHMRAYHGRAYVPSLLPKPVASEVVQ